MRILLALACAGVAAWPLCAQPAAVTAAPAAPAGGRLSIEALSTIPFLTSPILSPDGYRIAARVMVNGKSSIGIWDLRAREGTPPRLLAPGDFTITWTRWAGPRRLLAGVIMTQRLDGHVFPVRRIFALDVESFRVTGVNTGGGTRGDDVIFVDPEGAYILVSNQRSAYEYPAVLRVDLATNQSRTVQSPRTGVWNWFADRNGVVRAGIEYDTRTIRLYYRRAAGDELRQIESRRYPQDGSVIDMVRFVNNTDRGIVVTNAATGRFGVYEYDFATDTRGAAIFEHASVDVSEPIFGAEGVDGVAYEDDRRRTHWLIPDMQQIQRQIDRALPNRVNLMQSRSNDGQRILVWSSAADDPGTYYVFDRTARRLETFAAPYDALVGHRFAAVRPVRFPGRDGVEMNGYLTLPPGHGERGLPLVLLPHGGPFARDSWEFSPEVQFLASRGYAVLQVNFRGSTGYGRAWVERGAGQWGTGMIDDLEDGVDWLVRQGVVDSGRVCIMGASYGGYAALWAPIRNPSRYRCAVSFAGVADVPEMLRYDRTRFSAQRYLREWRRRVEGEEGADLAAVSREQQAARLRVPVLLAHGERDRNVPPSQSRELLSAAARAGTGALVQSVFYPEAEHGFTRAQDAADFLRRVEAFLARYNPPGAAAAARVPAASEPN